MLNFLEYLGRLPKALFIVFNIFLVLLISFIDYLTGPEISFSIYFLLPIAVATLFIGSMAGYTKCYAMIAPMI